LLAQSLAQNKILHNLPKLYEIIQKGFAYEELLSELEKKIKEVRELEDKYRS
jgi:hypothetical protein